MTLSIPRDQCVNLRQCQSIINCQSNEQTQIECDPGKKKEWWHWEVLSNVVSQYWGQRGPVAQQQIQTFITFSQFVSDFYEIISILQKIYSLICKKE